MNVFNITGKRHLVRTAMQNRHIKTTFKQAVDDQRTGRAGAPNNERFHRLGCRGNVITRGPAAGLPAAGNAAVARHTAAGWRHQSWLPSCS